jgi:hypothetical protein
VPTRLRQMLQHSGRRRHSSFHLTGSLLNLCARRPCLGNRDAASVFELLNIGRKLVSDSVLSVRLNPLSLRFIYGR